MQKPWIERCQEPSKSNQWEDEEERVNPIKKANAENKKGSRYDWAGWVIHREFCKGLRWSIGLVWLYGISTIVGYLMTNPVFYTYIKYMICKHILFMYTVKWSNSSISNNLV